MLAIAWQRRGKSSYLDIGTVFAIVVTIYGLFPALAFILASQDIGYVYDNRMRGYPNIPIIEQVQVVFLSFLATFCLAYAMMRRFQNTVYNHHADAGRYIWLILAIAILLALVPSIMKILLGVEFSADYVGSYIELRNYPVIVQQIFGVVDQLFFAFMIASIVFWVAYKPHLYVYILIVVLLNIIYASVSGGSRTSAFMGFFAYLISVSIYVKSISFRQLAPFGVGALVLFMFAGYWRAQQDGLPLLTLIQGGEFVALFSNSIDLELRIAEGSAAAFKHSFIAVDILKMIPSQLLNIEKIDPGTWYVQTYYPEYYASGGGFAFGTIAESVMGYGASEAAVRGGLLGVIFATAGNRLMERNGTILSVFIYVWLTAICYQSFRDTTFTFLTRSIYQILPLLILLRFVGFRPRPNA